MGVGWWVCVGMVILGVMQKRNLWAPWRIGYIKALGPAEQSPGGCFMCEAAAETGAAERERRLVLRRDERGVLMLNRYPYTNGHLLIAPLEHVPELSDMTAAQRGGLMELTELATRLLKAALDPQGINLGMNLGRCAGAGVPGHAHLHAVPRWNGDVNFMHVVADARVIPQSLDESYALMREVLEKIE